MTTSQRLAEMTPFEGPRGYKGKPVVIHTGVIKTGTTALQVNVFANAPGIHYLGKPPALASPRARTFLASLTHLDEARWQERAFALREDLAVLVHTDAPRILISEEEFSVGSADGLVTRRMVCRRLAELFPEATIVIVIRDQRTALQSLYAYWCDLRGGRPKGFNDWLRDLADKESRPHGLAIFDYATMIREHEDLRGRARVEVLLYEEFRDEYADFMIKLLGIIGVDLALAGAFSNVPLNVRPGFVTHLDIEYEPDTKRRVHDFYAAGNRRLVDERALDLAARGYPL